MVRNIPETDLTCENTSSRTKLLDRLKGKHAAHTIARGAR
jgi:hypothetical protein